jgi:hypothetical protein
LLLLAFVAVTLPEIQDQKEKDQGYDPAPLAEFVLLVRIFGRLLFDHGLFQILVLRAPHGKYRRKDNLFGNPGRARPFYFFKTARQNKNMKNAVGADGMSATGNHWRAA